MIVKSKQRVLITSRQNDAMSASFYSSCADRRLAFEAHAPESPFAEVARVTSVARIARK